MPKGINWNEQFYKLLRLSLGLTQEFPVDVDADGWRWASEAESIKGLNELLYQEAARKKRAINYQRTAADPRVCKHRNHQL